ncbi:MAG: Dabb family protein [Clostridia bacterium]
MLKYIVLFQFRDPEECLPTVIEKLHGMMGKIPEILSMETGVDLWRNETRSYDLALICTFADMNAVDIYDKHPLHQDARSYIYAHRLDGKTVIYEIEDAKITR